VDNGDKFAKAFERYLVGTQQSNGEWRAFCPIHEDPETSKSSSASLNFKTGLWHCMSAKCNDGGSIRELYRVCRAVGKVTSPAMGKHDDDDDNVISINRNSKDFVEGDEEDDERKPLPSEKQLRFWTKSLLSKNNALKKMTDERGLNKKSIRDFQIGWDGSRFTIPIRDEDGKLVNIRRYKPNARSHSDKMLSWGVGWGEGRLYGLDLLMDDDVKDIVLTEGEMDKIIGRQYDLPTVTHTSGSAVFKPEWAKWFKGKRVFVAYDDDKAGDRGAMKVAQVLKGVAEGVYRTRLSTGIDGGDLTDYFVKLGGDTASFMVLLKESETLWETGEDHKVPTAGRPVSVEESQSVEYDEPLELTVMVAGKQTPAFIAPKKITATCDLAAGPVCASCPMAVHDGQMTAEVHRDNPGLLEFINAGNVRKQELFRGMVGAKCKKHVEFNMDEQYSIEELVVQPSIEHRTEETETPITRKVYNIGTYKTPVNQLAKIIGKQAPDPQTQRGTFMGWDLEPVRSDIENFEMTPAVYRMLTKFQVKKGQTVMEKCMKVAKDLSANVTQIYGRELLHVAYDLVWHSVINFEFAGKPLTKGWLECLILGDTRTGKSEAANALRQHYQSGVMKSCEGATFAGLVGGAQKMGRNDQWMVTWGILPLNDRRLVVLDEMSGLMTLGKESKGIIENMSSVRSEGRAEINKIANQETSARTRLIWISNPNDRARLSDSPDGALNALRRLVRNPEDIARYDYVMAVANDEVDVSVINSIEHKSVKHRYNKESCSALVMWAWSRTSDQVRWAPGAEQAVIEAAADVGGRYVSDPPLVQAENIRIKIARLAVAFAARTFSTNGRGELLIVRKMHVKAAVEFLDMIYSSDAMGYAQHSNRMIKNTQTAQDNSKECRKYLRNNPELLDVLRGIGSTSFRPRDFEEQAALDRDSANMVVRKLIAWKMIRRLESGRMKIEPGLSRLLKELEGE
jgi:hypothetical protein